MGAKSGGGPKVEWEQGHADRQGVLPSATWKDCEKQLLCPKYTSQSAFHVAVGHSPLDLSVTALEPAMIKDIDEEIFGRCCDLRATKHNATKVRKKWDPSNLDWNLFHPNGLSRNYEILLAELGHTPQPGAEKDLSNDSNTSYAAVFLSHAEIHRFAARTGWLSLDLLSLYRLLRLLETVTLFEERTGDIVQLLVFVFEESEHMKNLEEMLCDYMVWNVEMLMHNAEFKSFLSETRH
ncbi:hypothetical protein ETB97_002189 [Aspergillus alliaceus]|uniref:Uncharacterized protein n=1 Tax=Petromyces alliaceus TaxID=209559 RepID=A0A8H6A3I0_PETAA|nr:hypothetical protein ETB97_002189 [Aspergillus burnettii]